jgi:hypothetical protein
MLRCLLIADQWGIAIFAALAAILWWRSAQVRLPKHVMIITTYGGTRSKDAQDLVDGLGRQAVLSKWAAICAGIAAALQAVATAFPS